MFFSLISFLKKFQNFCTMTPCPENPGYTTAHNQLTRSLVIFLFSMLEDVSNLSPSCPIKKKLHAND